MVELKFDADAVFSSGDVELQSGMAHYVAAKGSAGSRGWQLRWIKGAWPPVASSPLIGLVERMRLIEKWLKMKGGR